MNTHLGFYPLRAGYNDALGYYQRRDDVRKADKEDKPSEKEVVITDEQVIIPQFIQLDMF